MINIKTHNPGNMYFKSHMLKLVSLLLMFLSGSIVTFAQNYTTRTASGLVKAEKESFLRFISQADVDSNIINRLERFILIETDSLSRVIMRKRGLPEKEKVKAIRSIVFVMKGLREKMELQRPDTYDIPGSLESYKQFLHSLINKSGYEEVLQPLGAQRSQLLANTFWQCDECSMLNDIVVYKRLASAPDYILQNLEKNQHFIYRDSLILHAVKNNPVKVAEYIRHSRSDFKNIVRQHGNKYVQQVVQLAESRDASDLLPFTEQLTDGTITVEQILKERADVNRYFQLLVNTMASKLAGPTPDNGFESALRHAIQDKSMYFYMRYINDLHDEPDNVRFASVKGLRPQDLYYIITSSGEEMYTSSYLGLYNRMMAGYKNGGADSIFDIVKYDQFHKFIRLTANYNVLGDYLKHMDQVKAKSLLRRFIGGIETDTQNGVEKAMDIADLFTVLSSSPEISGWIKEELEYNFNRTSTSQQFYGARLYSILIQVFDLVQQNDPAHPLWATLGNHQLLKNKMLHDKNGIVNELVMFYGDKDGIASYNSFMNLFKDTKKWEINTNEQWVTIRSLSGEPIAIYANLPLSNEDKKDIEAQEALSAYLKQESIHPAILIHRGHSYHLEHTFKQLQPSMKLVLLGSCGGYNNNLSVANFSPDAQIIVSKKVGSKFINDPMIDIINQSLLNGNDLMWTKVWEDISNSLKKDAFTLNLFNEYIPPAKNVNIFVLKLFHNKEGVKQAVTVSYLR